MKGKVTRKLIDGLAPQEKPFEVRDTELRGFILRVQPSGVMTYICQYARGKRVTIGSADIMTPFAARELAKEVLAKFVTTGVDPMETRKVERAYTLRSFIDEKYKIWVESNHSRPVNTLCMIKAWYPELGDVKLADIKAWAVEKQRAAWIKAEDCKISTINHRITYLKVALNRAVAWGLLQSNPLASVKHSKGGDTGVVRYLSEDEDERLRAALNAREARQREQRKNFNRWRRERGYEPFPEYADGAFTDHLTPLVLLALNTGLRRGELFNLKWEDVSFDRGMLTVQGATAKSRKTRHVPLTEEASDALRRWRAPSQGTGLVFPNADGRVMDNITTSWQNLMKASRIKNFRFHDCRHTFASRLVMNGVDLNTVRELLGHADIKMTLRYAHLAPAKLTAAIATLNGRPSRTPSLPEQRASA